MHEGKEARNKTVAATLCTTLASSIRAHAMYVTLLLSRFAERKGLVTRMW